jgi:chemotaxis protein MotB
VKPHGATADGLDQRLGIRPPEPVTIPRVPVRALRPNPFSTLTERSRPSIDIDHNWLITLSDVLSLMLVFFLMLLVVSKATVKPVPPGSVQTVDAPSSDAGVPIADTSTRDTIVDEMSSDIQRLDMGDDVSVTALDKEIIITLKEQVSFRPGEAETLKTSEPILDNIADIIRQHPAFFVEIDGHTDNVPIRTARFPSNWELSVARATSVLKYFIGHHGIDPSHLSIKGNADQKPVVSNDTPENRARNRRVEIRLKENGS